VSEPYYSDDHCTIYHGDCRDILPTLSDIDMVFTSPPYNLGTTTGGGMHAGSLVAADLAGGYDNVDDAMPQDEYDRWQRWVLLTAWQTLSDTGAIFYNHKPRVQAGIAMLPTDYGTGLPLRQVIVWDRGTGMNFSDSFFLPKHEWIAVWAKPLFKLRDKSASQVGDVWSVRHETAQVHPAPFPVELPSMAIGATNAHMILDPFMGSGTTLRAAKDHGRRAIGIEMSERYCEIAAKRLCQEVLAL
jgi:site-specific DNA-methyltransferase (adenine-specific)